MYISYQAIDFLSQFKFLSHPQNIAIASYNMRVVISAAIQ